MLYIASSRSPFVVPVGSVVVRAMAFALVVAFIDLWLSVLSHAKELATFHEVFAPLATTALVGFAVYTLVWFVVGAPVARWKRLDGAACAFAVAVFATGLFTLLSLMGAQLSASNLFRYMILTLFAALLGLGGYAFARANAGAKAGGVGLSLPWVAAATLAFLWVEAYGMRSPLSGLSMAAIALWVIVSLVLLIAGARAGHSPWPRRAVALLFAFVMVGAVMGRLADRAPDEPPASRVSQSPTPRHVFLIVIDTLRRDALSCYGDGGAPTPNIDALAADGTLFEDAVSASSWTLPAMCSMMTGLATDVHGATQYRQALHDSVHTLADLLGAAGYRTQAIGSNPMLSPAYNVGQGFDTYDWYPRLSDDTSLGKRLLRRVFKDVYRRDLTTEGLSDAASEWIGAHQNESTFLWLHMFDPHHPYTPPQRFLPAGTGPPGMRTGFDDRKSIQAGTFAPTAAEREWIRKLYLGEVRYVDEQVGRFMGTLKRLGLYDDALIVLTSDHGEEFWDHRGFEHGHTLYRELLDVPLIIKAPGGNGVRDVGVLVATQSVTPTILELCHVEYDPSYVSASLVPLLFEGAATYSPAPVFSGGLRYFADRESVTDQHFQYIRSKVSGREQLFDRIADPEERTPLQAFEKDVLEKARSLMDAHVRTVGEAQDYLGIEGGWEADLDRETIQRLKALGYL